MIAKHRREWQLVDALVERGAIVEIKKLRDGTGYSAKLWIAARYGVGDGPTLVDALASAVIHLSAAFP